MKHKMNISLLLQIYCLYKLMVHLIFFAHATQKSDPGTWRFNVTALKLNLLIGMIL